MKKKPLKNEAPLSNFIMIWEDIIITEKQKHVIKKVVIFKNMKALAK